MIIFFNNGTPVTCLLFWNVAYKEQIIMINVKENQNLKVFINEQMIIIREDKKD